MVWEVFPRFQKKKHPLKLVLLAAPAPQLPFAFLSLDPLKSAQVCLVYDRIELFMTFDPGEAERVDSLTQAWESSDGVREHMVFFCFCFNQESFHRSFEISTQFSRLFLSVKIWNRSQRLMSAFKSLTSEWRRNARKPRRAAIWLVHFDTLKSSCVQSAFKWVDTVFEDAGATKTKPSSQSPGPACSATWPSSVCH